MSKVNSKAVSLVELLVASVLASIIIAALIQVIIFTLKTYDTLQEDVSRNQSIFIINEHLTHHIQDSAYSTITAGGSALSLYDASNTLLGSYNISNNTLTYTPQGGTAQTVSNNTSLTFTQLAGSPNKATEVGINITEPVASNIYLSPRHSYTLPKEGTLWLVIKIESIYPEVGIARREDAGWYEMVFYGRAPNVSADPIHQYCWVMNIGQHGGVGTTWTGLYRYSNDGTQLWYSGELSAGMPSFSADTYSGGCWLFGYNYGLRKISPSGTNTPIPVDYQTTYIVHPSGGMAASPFDGSVWYGVYDDIKKYRLFHVSADGATVHSSSMLGVRSLSVDGNTGDCWVGDDLMFGGKALKKYDKDFTLEFTINEIDNKQIGGIGSVSVDKKTGNCWASAFLMGAGWRIVIINANGNIQNILDIGINDQLFLTADHTDGYCWVSYYTGGQIFKIDSTGSVVVAAKPYTNPRAVSLGYEE